MDHKSENKIRGRTVSISEVINNVILITMKTQNIFTSPENSLKCRWSDHHSRTELRCENEFTRDARVSRERDPSSPSISFASDFTVLSTVVVLTVTDFVVEFDGVTILVFLSAARCVCAAKKESRGSREFGRDDRRGDTGRRGGGEERRIVLGDADGDELREFVSDASRADGVCG